MFRNKFNSVVVNGQIFNCSGSNITISNGKVIVDGKVVTAETSPRLEVTINGDVNKLDCDGSATIYGNAGSIDCGGSCHVDGNITGNIDAGGSVTCGNVMGDIDAGGSVRCRR